MSYLDYRVTLDIVPDMYLAGKETQMTVVAAVDGGNGVIMQSANAKIPPVTNEQSLKEAFAIAFAKLMTASWKSSPFSLYKPGEFVRVTSEDGSHGFPVGSIIKLIAMDEEDCLNDAPDLTWIASGYTTSLHDVGERYIGENAFVKVGSEE